MHNGTAEFNRKLSISFLLLLKRITKKLGSEGDLITAHKLQLLKLFPFSEHDTNIHLLIRLPIKPGPRCQKQLSLFSV
jgi:hypothetical protein